MESTHARQRREFVNDPTKHKLKYRLGRPKSKIGQFVVYERNDGKGPLWRIIATCQYYEDAMDILARKLNYSHLFDDNLPE